jgi:predicted DCC family thiol-disulfide oxidoreductase YuxK
MLRDMPHPIILYDGVCGLCNRRKQFFPGSISKASPADISVAPQWQSL